MNKYVPAMGNPNAVLAIVGEAPSYDEEEQGLPFVGPAGRVLDGILHAAHISRDDIWITNVSKYMVVAQKKGRQVPFHIRAQQAGINLDEQINDLRKELATINPNCILALGSSALYTLYGKDNIGTLRGSILQTWSGRKLVATWHPTHLIHQEKSEIAAYWQRQVMIFDFKRAAQESLTKEINLPSRNLQICKSSAQLYDFIQRKKIYEFFKKGNLLKLSKDIEVVDGGCIPGCVGLAVDKYEGLCVPLWNHLPDYPRISDTELTSIWIMLAKLFMSTHTIGANFKYDQDKLTRLGLPIRKLVSDVMLKAFVLNPELPKNLAFNTSIFTREPFYKDEGMYEGTTNDLFIGCARDACVTYEVDENMDPDLDESQMRDFYENFIMHLHYLYLDIEAEGFMMNFTKRDELLRKYITWDERLRYEMFKMAGANINVNSWKQVGSLLYDNLKLPQRGGTGEEVLTQLLNQNVKNELQRRIIENILEARRVRKTVSTYITALPDFNGKMKSTYFICLETGRTSTGQQEPPIRPIQEVIDVDDNGKRKKKKKPLGTAFQVMTKHGDIGPEIRSMYEPEPGHIFIQIDSAAAEARITALLANDDEMLLKYDTIDVHAWTASLFFGAAPEKFSKKILGYECPERFIGKTLRHAGERGMKRRRAAIEVNTSARKYKVDIKITEGEAERHLKNLHKWYPNLQGVYFKEVIECLARNRQLIAPLPYGIDAKYGGKRTFFERWGDELNRQAFSYIPQRAVTDNTKAAALRIRARAKWIRIILESHDSLLLMVPINRKLEAGIIAKEEMERPLNFENCSLPRRSLSIPAELEEGYNYYELSKFKFIEPNKILELK